MSLRSKKKKISPNFLKFGEEKNESLVKNN